MIRSTSPSHRLHSSHAFLFIAAMGFAVCVATVAQADTLVLGNGRTLQDAKIVSVSPLTVTVRYAGGFTQVQKSLLPESLRSQYPVDPAAAAALAQKDKERRERLEAEARLKREAAEKKAEQSDPNKKSALTPAEAEAALAADAKIAAHDRALSTAAEHFRTKWTPRHETVEVSSLLLKVDALDQSTGSDGMWSFTGSGSVDYRDQTEQAQAGGHPASEPGKAHRALVAFEGTIKPDGSTTLTPRVVTVMDYTN